MRNQLLIYLFLFFSIQLFAQIPVEVMAGDKQASFDLMFFKFFKSRDDKNSPVLFFNRNIATLDYRMTDTTFLPYFAFTEAVSYNHKKLKAFAPVAVCQFNNRGIDPKGGLQYARVKEHLTIFSWFVSEVKEKPELDYYLLVRFTPKINEKLKFYSQFESLNVFSTVSAQNNRFYQRIRLGLGLHDWQFGVAANLTELNSSTNNFSSNVGGFLRHEF
jgi:hypothetical protein